MGVFVANSCEVFMGCSFKLNWQLMNSVMIKLLKVFGTDVKEKSLLV